jgi:hypothetical protein
VECEDPVGAYPKGMTFDGVKIWVVCQDDHIVTAVRASDCTVKGNFPVGYYAEDAAFDGSSIWVTTLDAVIKLRAKNGAPEKTYPMTSQPIGICFDGSSISVTNTNSDSVSKITRRN